jgi:threonine/homoserine/homoserine lactone efflux protein
MTIDFLLKGVILGFSIAAPVGPIGVLCIRKTLQFDRWSNSLLSGQFWLRLIGGGFLLYLGWKTFIAKPAAQSKEMPHTSLLYDFISTFCLTITSPMTIITFLAIFAGFGFTAIQEDYTQATAQINLRKAMQLPIDTSGEQQF